MEIHFLEIFRTQYSQIDYRSEIELFQFKDSKITKLLIDLVSGYLPGRLKAVTSREREFWCQMHSETDLDLCWIINQYYSGMRYCSWTAGV